MCWGDYHQNSKMSLNRQEQLRDSFSKRFREGNINLCVSLNVQIQTGIF